MRILLGKRLWFNGRTLPCQGRDSGPIPGSRTEKRSEAKTALKSRFCLSFGFVSGVDKGVHTVDKRQQTFWRVREIVSK